jgi:alpha-N-arabinofuranosidase
MATTSMVLPDRAAKLRAGLAAFQSEDFHYVMTVGSTRGRLGIRLESRIGGVSEVAAEEPLTVSNADGAGRDARKVLLRIEATGSQYRFSYAVEDGASDADGTASDAWQILADSVDGRVLSTKPAGGFVGTRFGLYAYTE